MGLPCVFRLRRRLPAAPSPRHPLFNAPSPTHPLTQTAIPAGFALLSYAFGRIFYFSGYAEAPEKRINLPSILLTYPALFCLWGLSLATAIQLFRQVQPCTFWRAPPHPTHTPPQSSPRPNPQP